MQYEIIGGAYPAVTCTMNQGEKMRCEGGAMSWMTDGFTMKTEGGGSIKKAIGRNLSGESAFFNVYEATQDGAEITFSSSFPGKILAIPVKPGQSIIAQKDSFLACMERVNVQMHFKKKIGAGLFGGFGFFMQKFSGEGIAFLELGGSIVEKVLAPGQILKVDAPYLALMSESCSMELERISGAKNVVFGGEGLFNTVVTGPGKVWLQTMPMIEMAARVAKHISTSSD